MSFNHDSMPCSCWTKYLGLIIIMNTTTIRTYDLEYKANMAFSILETVGIKSVISGSDNQAIEGSILAYGGIEVQVIDSDRVQEANKLLIENGCKNLIWCLTGIN